VIRKLKTEQLRVGMHVVDTSFSHFDYPRLYSVAGEIRSREEIERVMDAGYQHVFVDDTLGSHDWGGAGLPDEQVLRAVAGVEDHRRTHDIPCPGSETLRHAHDLYSRSLAQARSLVARIRRGEEVDVEASIDLIRDIVHSLSDTRSALLSLLIKLRRADEYTYTHSVNTTVLAVVYGHHLGLSKDELVELGQAAMFHDVGKLSVPEPIITKPGSLTPEEFALVQAHPERGYDIMRANGGVAGGVLRGILEHHEKYDGSGYPNGRSGEETGFYSRLVHLVDVYDALTSDRVYKCGVIPSRALAIMYSTRDMDFSCEEIESFVKCFGIYPVGAMVKLSTGDLGVVTVNRSESPLHPVVRVVLDEHVRPRERTVVDLAETEDITIVEAFDYLAHNINVSYLL
jgi:HD-GYP domain-containing protein (c-di-GMP phosphodiesterase class II)